MVQHEVSLSAFDSHWPAMRYLSTKAGVDHATRGAFFLRQGVVIAALASTRLRHEVARSLLHFCEQASTTDGLEGSALSAILASGSLDEAKQLAACRRRPAVRADRLSRPRSPHDHLLDDRGTMILGGSIVNSEMDLGLRDPV